MIDLKQLRKDPEAFRAALKGKRYDPADLDALVSLDAELRDLLGEVEALRAERNAANQAIKGASPEDRPAAIEKSKTLKASLGEKEARLAEVEPARDEVWLRIPNPPAEDVPAGETDEDNGVLKQVGEPRALDFEAQDHLGLTLDRRWIDMERGAKVGGSRFAFLHGPLVHLQLALMQYSLRLLEEEGFLPTIPPIMVREAAMRGTGFFPADANEIYKIEGEDHFMVGTSEVSLAGQHMDEIFDLEQLPLRYAGYSTCLRREAGAAGKDTRGIFRVHQFDKVEMFAFCRPEDSAAEHERMLAIEERILGDLELPYRVVNVCDGDLGAPAAKKYDIEAWFPGQQRYREVTSCSNTTDFQARRLKARFKGENGKTRLVHTLNGTAVAVGRTLIALMENHQQADGSVAVPAALRPFLPGAPERLG